MAEDQEKLMRQAFQYQETLEAYANAILHNWNLSKDAVQEAFILTSVKWQTVDEKYLFAWLKKITRDKAYDIIRKQSRQSKVKDEILKMVDTHFTNHLDEEVHERNKKRMVALEGCMKKLRPESMKLMVGFYKEKKSCDVLSQEMSRSVNAIRILLHRTRDALKKCVKLSKLENE